MKKKITKKQAEKLRKEQKELKIFIGVMAALAILYSINILGTYSILSGINEQKEQIRPANLEITQIIDSSCVNCADLGNVISRLVTFDTAKITDNTVLNSNSSEGAELIRTLGITKLPALVISGEVEKSNVQNLWNNDWEKKNNVVLFKGNVVPYVDLETSNIVGLVSATTIIDSSCEECFDMKTIIDFFKQAGVKFSDERITEYNESQDIINKYNITRIPTLVISSNIREYPAVNQIWNQLNALEKDGFYALHSTAPPYLDLNSSKIIGSTNIIYLQDSSCSDCYNVSINKQILERSFGVYLANETTLEVSSEEGQALIEKYNITTVPIILLSQEAGAYEQFKSAWENVGSVESDGWYVMRNPSVLGKTKNLLEPEINSTELTIEGSEFEYNLSKISVKKGERVTINFKNTGESIHDLYIEGIDVGTELKYPGESQTIEFIAEESGTFKFYCTVPGHRELGMEGEIIVS